MTHAVPVVPAAIALNAGLFALAHFAAVRYNASSILSLKSAGLLLAGMLAESACLLKALPELPALPLAVALSAAVVCAATDAAAGYVFDVVTLPAIAGVILMRASSGSGIPALCGAAVCGGSLFFLYALTGGRGLGLGDVKLALAIGSGIGAKDAIAALGLAFIAGGAYAAFLLVTGRAHRGDSLRFAPYMAAAMLAVTLYRVTL